MFSDKKIFVGDAYAEFIVPNELPKRKLSACSSNLENSSGNLELIATRNSKWLLTNEPNGERACHRLVPPSSPSKVDDCNLRVKNDYVAPLPPDQNVPITQKTPCRLRSSCDSKSYGENSHPQTVEKRSSLPAKRGSSCSQTGRKRISWNSPFLSHSLKDIIRIPQTPLSGGDDLMTTPQRMSPTRERKRNSPIVPQTPSSGSDDLLQSRRAFASDRKSESSFSSATSSSGNHDSFATPEKARTTNGEYYSHVTPTTPSSGGYSLPRKMVTTKRKCNSPTHRTTPSSGDNFYRTSSRSLHTHKRKRNSNTRAEDNLNGSYDDGSTEDEVQIENAEKIRDEFFEKYFASDPRRPDRIHLNTKGLCAIKGIIQSIINVIK